MRSPQPFAGVPRHAAIPGFARATPRRWLTVAVLAAVAACREGTAPHGPDLSLSVTPNAPIVLEQSATAPPLQAYQVSFWLSRRSAATIAVNYAPTGTQTTGQPFLRFDVPQNGVVAGAGGIKLKPGDSVFVTMTIDTLTFSVHFEPTGVLFATQSPATLTVWYGNANLDLNGNGVVDGWDWMQLQQLAVWYMATGTAGYQVMSRNDTTSLVVSAPIYHFSQYAVSY